MATIPRLNENLVRIRNLDDNAPFRAWLAAELSAEMKILVGANDDRSAHQAQGAVRKLEQLTELIDGSAGRLEKSRG